MYVLSVVTKPSALDNMWEFSRADSWASSLPHQISADEVQDCVFLTGSWVILVGTNIWKLLVPGTPVCDEVWLTLILPLNVAKISIVRIQDEYLSRCFSQDDLLNFFQTYFFSSFIEMWFMLYSSMIFSIFIICAPITTVNFLTFSSPPKETWYPSVISPLFPTWP